MLSLEEVRNLLDDKKIPDEELVKLRDALYPFVERILDDYLESIQ